MTNPLVSIIHQQSISNPDQIQADQRQAIHAVHSCNRTAATEEAEAIKQKLSSSQQVAMDQARGGHPLGWQPFPLLSMASLYTSRLSVIPYASGMVGSQPDSLPTARVVLPFPSTMPWAASKVPSCLSSMTALGISLLNFSPRFALIWPLSQPSNVWLGRGFPWEVQILRTRQGWT